MLLYRTALTVALAVLAAAPLAVKKSRPLPYPPQGTFVTFGLRHSLIEIRHAEGIYVSLPRARYD
jgi:hypothetical protein